MGDVVVLDPNRRGKTETVKAVELLLAECCGKNPPIGIAYILMRQGQDYSIGIAGETLRCPTFTRGMLHRLDDELAALLRPPKK